MFIPKEIKLVLPKEILFSIEQSTKLDNGHTLQEIRIRNKRPLMIKTNQGNICIQEKDKDYVVSESQMNEIVALLSGYSLYAFEDELRQGFITIAGGHRVGFCGKAIMEQGAVKTLRKISSVNIRVAKEVKGCAREWMPYLYEKDRLCHTLIISPPGCGKTTLLRDMICHVSNGWGNHQGKTIGVVDERSEISPMVNGICQMDVGDSTDVLEGCPKAEGMLLLLRSMGPEVIAVDELGRVADFTALESLLYAGVTVLATVHGNNMDELKGNPNLRSLIERHVFERYIFLSKRDGVGTVESILEGEEKRLYGKEG